MQPQVEPGLFVRLKVSDTGIGMDADTVERAFEPFFSTKSKAEGTGLGLATVYGIVTGAGGRIDIYSEPGIGTTVKIHLPATSKALSENEVGNKERPRGQGEMILVVEDEADVRRMAERILTEGGYSVISASGGEEAIGICQELDQPIDALLTDVIMPGMLGTELVGRVKTIRPDVVVIYMSGYSHEVLKPDTLSGQGAAAFIEKPYGAAELLRALRDLLGRRAGVTDDRQSDDS